MDGKGITGLLIAVTIGAVFFVPVVDVIDSTTGEVEINNETVTTNASYDETYELRGDDVVTDSDTLERYNSSADSWEVLASGTDYELDNTNGTVDILSGGSVAEGDEVRASYNYQATEGIVTSVAGLLPIFLALLLLVPMADKVQQEV